MAATLVESFLLMGTMVSIRVVGQASDADMHRGIDGAIRAMRAVEDACSRFDEASALRALCRQPRVWVPVPPILFHALKIACEVGELTDGVFDPTVGRALELQGFNRHYLTGAYTDSAIELDPDVSYRDITLVDEGLRVRLEKPMLLDLGAVAKGLAVDLAVRELGAWPGVAINAGGDIYVAGTDPDGGYWHVGIEDPAYPTRLLGSLHLSGMAVCTSGSYRRVSPHDKAVHHLWNPIMRQSAQGLLSCTVAGPQAVMADVVATAAFLLGPSRALTLIETMGLAGLCVDRDQTVWQTQSMRRLFHESA